MVPINKYIVIICIIFLGVIIASPVAADSNWVNDNNNSQGSIEFTGETTGQPSEIINLSIEVTNTGDSPDNYIAELSLPVGWTLESKTDGNGIWNEKQQSWLWINLAPGESVNPTLTVRISKNAENEIHNINTTLISTEGEDTAQQKIRVQEPSKYVTTGSYSLLQNATSETELELEDSTPDQDGVTVRPNDILVTEITFHNEPLDGSVKIETYRELSETLNISENNIHSVTYISPSSAVARNTSATIEFGVDDLNSSRDPLILHENDEWKRLETTVDRTTDITKLEADIESFSLFAIVEENPADDTSENKETPLTLQNVTLSEYEVEPGQSINVTANITGSGNLETRFRVNGEIVKKENITVENSTRQVFEYTATEEGNYVMSVNNVFADAPLNVVENEEGEKGSLLPFGMLKILLLFIILPIVIFIGILKGFAIYLGY